MTIKYRGETFSGYNRHEEKVLGLDTNVIQIHLINFQPDTGVVKNGKRKRCVSNA
jgi:hypothetical protein